MDQPCGSGMAHPSHLGALDPTARQSHAPCTPWLHHEPTMGGALGGLTQRSHHAKRFEHVSGSRLRANGMPGKLAPQRPWSVLLAGDSIAVLYSQLRLWSRASRNRGRRRLSSALLAESWRAFILLLGLRSYCRPPSPPWGYRTEVIPRALLVPHLFLRAILAGVNSPCMLTISNLIGSAHGGIWSSELRACD